MLSIVLIKYMYTKNRSEEFLWQWTFLVHSRGYCIIVLNMETSHCNYEAALIEFV